jgi:type VI secretion system protein ImpH
MAAESSRYGTDLERRLRDEPYRFEFFQAVRMLERRYRDLARKDPRWRRTRVGHDDPPGQEAVRFRASTSHSFPAGHVQSLEQPRPEQVRHETALPPPEMQVNFLGLTGPSGVLPDHYTTLLLQRTRLKDASLRDFLDAFNHRTVSLFYRAWEKYRFPVQYERAASEEDQTDAITWALYCLTGMGSRGLSDRRTVSDETSVKYSGHFSRAVPTAVGLEDMLCEHFELPVKVHQFLGEWLTLELFERSALPRDDEPFGRHNHLGQDTILGSRVWDLEGCFRLRVGPLTYFQFREFMPTGGLLRPFCELVRTYVGMQFRYDVQPVLAPFEAPPCYLGAETTDPPLLGWNTWLHAQPIDHEFDGVSFSLDAR